MSDEQPQLEFVTGGIIMRSKRQATLYSEIKNVSPETWLTFKLTRVEIRGLGECIISYTEMIKNFAPGETKLLEAEIILPPNLALSFDSDNGSTIPFHLTFDTTSIMPREAFDALPEWA